MNCLPHRLQLQLPNHIHRIIVKSPPKLKKLIAYISFITFPKQPSLTNYNVSLSHKMVQIPTAGHFPPILPRYHLSHQPTGKHFNLS